MWDVLEILFKTESFVNIISRALISLAIITYEPLYHALQFYGNCTPMLKIKNKLQIGCFYKQSWEELAIFWAFLINNYSPRACWIWDDYSHPPSHIQRTLLE